MNIYTLSFQSEWLTSLVFFFRVKKERKKHWGNASPKPRRPWRSWARGQLGLRIKRVLLKLIQLINRGARFNEHHSLGAKLFLFILVLMSFRPRTSTPRPLGRNLVKLFLFAWNKKIVKSKWIWVRLHSNSWQTFLFHAVWQIRRVKAKSAITLELKPYWYA